MSKSEKIRAEEVEVINESTNPEKITRVRVEDENSSKNDGIPSVEEFLKQMNGGGESPLGDNPLFKILSDPEEQKKLKTGSILIFLSILFGIIGLFGFRDITASTALILGTLAYFLGADILKKGALFGIFIGLLGLVLHIA